MGFVEENKGMTITQCFNALKVHKEQKKLEILKQSLKNEMDPAIEEHSSFNKGKASKLQKSQQNRAGQIVTNMLGKRLFAYFEHWKTMTASKST